MLRANALFIVIVLALVIGVICSSIILLAYNYKIYIIKQLLNERLELNAESGKNFILSDLQVDSSLVIDLFANGDSVEIRKNPWGLFDIGISKAFIKQEECVKIFQIGSRPSGSTNSAIYLLDEGTGLSVSGTTVIKGNCYLPARGIKATHISGNFFLGDKLVEGLVLASDKKLPSIDGVHIDNLIRLIEMPYDSLLLFFSIEDQRADTITRSFSEKPLLIYQHGAMKIGGQYKGHIMLVSDSMITIEPTALIQDVVVVAPKIIIRSGLQGNFQAYASDTLAIEDNVTMQYPSIAAIIKSDFSLQRPAITIGKGAQVSGFIFAFQKVQDTRRTLIKTFPNSHVFGQIYSDGFVELGGTVIGGVMCKKFILNTSSSSFENHLLNVTIDHESLSRHYLMPSLIETEDDKGIVKWLY